MFRFKRENSRKGFTMIELVVVIVVLGIIAAIAIPTGIGYISKANQDARNKTARTIFLAAQNALSSGYRIPDDAATASPYYSAKGNPNIVYMSLNSTDANGETKPLYSMLNPYLTDKEPLSNSILLEVNKKTNRAITVFYSDMAESIGYDSKDEYDASTDSSREENTLKEAQVGYYDVNAGDAEEDEDDEGGIAKIELVDYNDKLSVSATHVLDLGECMSSGSSDSAVSVGNNINGGDNYGLLTMEITLPDTKKVTADYNLGIKLLGSEESEELNISSSDTGDMALPAISQCKDVDDAVARAQTAAVNSQVRKYPAFVQKNASGKDILVIILDCQAEGLSFHDNHGALGCTDLSATLEVSNSSKSWTSVDTNGQSQTVNSYFGALTSAEKSQLITGSNMYVVDSIRHLNNIRYMENNAENKYIQSSDIFCRNYMDEEDILNFKPIIDVTTKAEVSTKGFKGEYIGAGNRIIDLEITAGSGRAFGGLFSAIAKSGKVSGVELAYSDGNNGLTNDSVKYFMAGTTYVGGIAGYNQGEISRCSVRGMLYGFVKNGTSPAVGGITGLNEGTVTECFAGADVTAKTNSTKVSMNTTSLKNLSATSTNFDDYNHWSSHMTGDESCAGGVAGENNGTISSCEVGTAYTSYYSYSEKTVPYFGTNLVVNSLDAAYANRNYELSANDSFKVEASGCAGGIAGKADGTNTITACVNASKVTSDCESAGGLVGRYESSGTNINRSYNAGTVQGYKFAGGIAGNGAAGAAIKSCYNNGKIARVSGVNACCIAGGILGYGAGAMTLSDCYNIGDVAVLSNPANSKYYSDGIVWNVNNVTDKSECSDCAALGDSGTPGYSRRSNYGFSPTYDRAYLSAYYLKRMSFTDMIDSSSLKGTDTKTGSSYDYPYLDFSKISGASDSLKKLGKGFHRTK